jgi:hypothetical protein
MTIENLRIEIPRIYKGYISSKLAWERLAENQATPIYAPKKMLL